MRNAFIRELINFSSTNEVPYLITGDLGFSVIEEFQAKYPNKFINAGILEQSLVGIATGLALQGNKVFVYSITNFVTFRALEQLRLDISHHSADVCVVGVGVGFQYQSAGYSHWGIEDLAVVSSLQNFTIYSPCNEESTILALQQILSSSGPSYLRLGKATSFPDLQMEPVFLGSLARFIGSGKNLVVTHGSIAGVLAGSPIFDTDLFKLVIINNLSEIEIIKSSNIFSNCSSITVVEENIFSGGLGSNISRYVAEEKLNVSFKWIGVRAGKIESVAGDLEFLRQRFMGDYTAMAFAKP
jgi:transketolase